MHWLKIDDLKAVEATEELLKSLQKEDKILAKRLKEAYKIADQHEIDLAINIKDGAVSYAPVTNKEDEAPLSIDEAIILAVELHHIFKNNSKVHRLSVNPSTRTVYTYMYSGFIGKEPHVTVIVLNAKGSFLASYDPKRQELFPKVPNLSSKAFKKCDVFIADTLNALTKQYKANIEKERAEEGASAETDDSIR